MALEDLQREWDELGRTDPLWAILTDPSKRDNRWDREEFFATGETEIECLLDYVATLPVPLRRGRALDFGCGVGRLTQALARHFAECVGVDIAPSMIALARRYNRFGERCRYVVNGAPDLSLFAADHFDLVYSNIVLQHIPPEHAARYIEEFVRVLAPGGIAVFQVPSERVGEAPRPPEALFNARLTADLRETTLSPGAALALVVTVENASAETWPVRAAAATRYAFRLGNHWRRAGGDMWQMDDGRAALPGDLGPSERIDLPLTVTAPSEPGDYLLELDLVQENVAWFADKGSATIRVPVRVVATSTSAATPPPGATAPSPPPPGLSMHCIPRPEVIALVMSAGGRLVDVQEYGSAGPEHVSYRYCVSK